MDEWELEAGQNDDYEYGFDYLYEEKENRPADAAEDADEPDDEERWWEEDDEEALLDEVRETDISEDAAYWQDDEVTDVDEAPALSYAEILADIRAEEKEKQETGAQKAKKKLVRDMKAEALLRMESAARSEKEFAAVQKVWDDRDESRERWERMHEVLQGDTSLETMLNIKMMLDLMMTDENHPIRLCKQCMKPFLATGSGKLFCSPQCAKRYRREHK